MQPQELIKQGKLSEALTALQNQVRSDPSNARHRVFLFQLLSVLGQWPRALTQLNVAGELDPAALPMVQTYREAIQCEALRAEIFAGSRAPIIFGEPLSWIAQLVEALRFDARDPAAAARLRAEAFDAAPTTAGSIDGQRFAWLADADSRLGPVLEAVVNGRYFWIPYFRIARIEIDPPVDLRDTVWTAATLTFVTGAQAVGLIPTRYPGSEAVQDDALKLARRTEWVRAGGADYPLGQRMLASDADEFALMDARVVDFDCPADAADMAALDTEAAHG